jgi:hypothetical protein
MHFDELMYTDICHHETTKEDIDDFADAVYKVIENIDELKG